MLIYQLEVSTIGKINFRIIGSLLVHGNDQKVTFDAINLKKKVLLTNDLGEALKL